MADKPVSGISLHVESNGDEPAQVLTFMKDKCQTVTIGRRSTQAKHSRVSTYDTALFRCPVISRRHAQISFLENGTVSVKDMNSHHGTHILKPGQSISTPVSPKTSSRLEHGDTITFGKSVGREETYVRPMVAKVHMHFAVPSSTPSSSSAFATPLSALSGPTPAHSSTGRYGLAALNVLSDSSESDDDSDVEEHPMRTSNAAPVPYSSHFPLFSPVPQLQMQRPLGLGLCGSYFPSDVRPFLHNVQVEERDDDDEGENSEGVRSNRFSPIEVSSASPSRSPSVVEIQPPSQSHDQSQDNEVLTGEWSSPSSTPEPQPAQERFTLHNVKPPTPASQYNTAPIISDSDLWHLPPFMVDPPLNIGGSSTPSAFPGPATFKPRAECRRPDDLFMHSTGHPVFSFANTSNFTLENNVVAEREPSPEDMQLSDDEEEERIEPAQIERAGTASLESTRDTEQPIAAAEPEPQLEPAPEREPSQAGIESRIELLKTTIAELGERMSQDSPSTGAAQATDNAEPLPPQPETQAQFEARVTPAPNREIDVRMQSMVEVALQELRAEHDALKARCAEIAELVSQAKALALLQQSQTSSPLKRKRDETLEDDDQLSRECNHVRPIKRKRSLAMRVASGVAKTTAIAAVGAVATWSALAFS